MNRINYLLSHPVISSIRRNHGLEHATLHVFADMHVHGRFAGYSDNKGFWLLGIVPTDTVERAVNMALHRLAAGEKSLAVHPNCGTNFLTSGFLVGGLAWFIMLGSGRGVVNKLKYLPALLVITTLALIASQPLGAFLQEKVTTSGDPGALQIVRIVPLHFGRITLHRIVTRG